jgi:endoglycosylceramidase
LQGPLDDLGDRRTSAQVLRAFDSFYAEGDPHGLQAQFIEMLELVATRWGQHPAVVGFELFNEPIGLQPLLSAFDANAAAAIGRIAPTKLVFFEPSSLRNFTDAAPLARAPFPEPNAVYSPHIYTFVFSPDRTHLERLQPSDLETSVRDARTEAEAWKTPLFIGEFGIGPTDPNADLWMNVQSELHDAVLASNAFWVWKEQSQASWGVHAWDGAQWSERPQVVSWVSRIHAARIAGTVVANQWDRLAESLTLVTTGARQPHAIYIPERFAATARVRCNDAPLAPSRDAITGLVAVDCDGSLQVDPR